MRSRALGAIHLLALAALSGCATRQAVTSADITPRTEVRVRFETARSLILTAAEAELALGGVLELEGRMIGRTADSIKIGAASATLGSGGTQRFGAGTTTMIAVSGASFEKIERHTGRTIALFGILILGAAILIAAATYQEPPPPPPPEPKPKA